MVQFAQFARPQSIESGNALVDDKITRLLGDWREGDRAAAAELFPIVYDELRALAASYFRREPAEHTLQPTALVHEAYLRLQQQTRIDLKDRHHFFALAARLMRRILVDHARGKARDKRAGSRERISLDEAVVSPSGTTLDLLAVDEALDKLADMSERKARLVELRFFAGLTEEEAADILGIARSMAAREWAFTRTWLSRELRGAASE